MRYSSVGGGGVLSYEQLPLSVLPNNDHSVLPDTIFSREKFMDLYLLITMNLYYISSLNIRIRFITWTVKWWVSILPDHRDIVDRVFPNLNLAFTLSLLPVLKSFIKYSKQYYTSNNHKSAGIRHDPLCSGPSDKLSLLPDTCCIHVSKLGQRVSCTPSPSAACNFWNSRTYRYQRRTFSCLPPSSVSRCS